VSAGVEITVVVAARDAAATLPGTLDALAAQAGAPPYEVVVVDDGSRDATARIAEDHPLRPQVLRRAAEGVGAARAAGVRAGSGAALAFTDADCRPAPGWLAAGHRALQDAELVQGAVRPDPAAVRTPFDRTLSVERESGLYETANLFLRRAAYDAAGGFGPGFQRGRRTFGEDVVLAWRVRRTGARTAFRADALVHHAVFPGTPRQLLADRARLRFFCALVAEFPELREGVMHRRWFLSPRTLDFDLAVAGALAALAARSPLPLLAAAAYARRARREWAGPRHAAILALADAVALAALLRGSLERRALLL